MSSTQLPLEYLVTSSENCLEGFELARLNQISNLRKEFSEIFDDLVEAETAARLARWMLEGRRSQGQSAPLAQIASNRTPAHELRTSASQTQQIPLLRGNSKAASRRHSKNSSSRQQACRGRQLGAGADRAARPSSKRQSDFGNPTFAIARAPSAALQLLEKTAARDAQSIGRSARSAVGDAQRGSLPRTRMLPFPGARGFEDSESVALPIRPATTLPRVSPRPTVAALLPRTILSLPLLQLCNRPGVHQFPMGAAETRGCDPSSDGDARNVVRPFPPVRAPLRKPLIYGNVALSRF